MPLVEFGHMPAEARLWVFGTGRPIDEGEESSLLDSVDAFLESWKAHGSPLDAAREWYDERFLLVAVDERTAPPSGCSIDALVRVLRGVEERLGFSLVDHHSVWYREDGAIRCVDRSTFRALAKEGRVGPDTVVFDTTLTRMAALRGGEFERPAAGSWHGRAFFSRVPSPTRSALPE